MLFQSNDSVLITFLNTFTTTQQYFVASWICHSSRRSNILLRSRRFCWGSSPDLANLHAKGHYCCYFHHDCLRRKCASFCCILILFSVIWEQWQSRYVTSPSKMASGEGLAQPKMVSRQSVNKRKHFCVNLWDNKSLNDIRLENIQREVIIFNFLPQSM